MKTSKNHQITTIPAFFNRLDIKSKHIDLS